MIMNIVLLAEPCEILQQMAIEIITWDPRVLYLHTNGGTGGAD